MDDSLRADVLNPEKKVFKLFDFFANCEYFEEGYNYDEVLKLPEPQGKGPEGGGDTGPAVVMGAYEHLAADILATIKARGHRLRGDEDRPDVLREV